MTIHKEGYRSLLLTIAFVILVNGAIRIAFPGEEMYFLKLSVLIVTLLFFLIILQFFRHPKRNIPLNEKHVICPADGKVVVIEEVTETEYFHDKRIQVSVFMSPINVHVNRYPVGGVIDYLKYHPGLFLVAWHPKASTDNERTTIVIKKQTGVAVLVRQIAGALAKRIVYYPKQGDTVKQGDELGFIKFGSRVDLFLPVGSKIMVQMNQKVTGGETVLAELPA